MSGTITKNVTNDGSDIYEHSIPHYSYWDCNECSNNPDTDVFFSINYKSQAIEHVRETGHAVIYQVGFGKVFTTEEYIDEE